MKIFTRFVVNIVNLYIKKKKKPNIGYVKLAKYVKKKKTNRSFGSTRKKYNARDEAQKQKNAQFLLFTSK